VFLSIKLNKNRNLLVSETQPTRSKLGATPEPPYQAGVKDMLYDLLLNTRARLKSVRDRLFKTEQNIGIAPQTQKMPGGITKAEVEDFLYRLDPNRKFKVRQVFKDCVEIEE
jgi:hypothetical protein